MTDFETRPAGTAARIAELTAAQKYRYIGKDGKPVLARELEDRIEQLEAALTRANAAAAAAYEVAARLIQPSAEPSYHIDLRAIRGQYTSAIRALATPDQTAALDKLIAEAYSLGFEAGAWDQAEKLDGDYYSELPENLRLDALLAASKKGGV